MTPKLKRGRPRTLTDQERRSVVISIKVRPAHEDAMKRAMLAARASLEALAAPKA